MVFLFCNAPVLPGPLTKWPFWNSGQEIRTNY
jgi:hypothetical protein